MAVDIEVEYKGKDTNLLFSLDALRTTTLPRILMWVCLSDMLEARPHTKLGVSRTAHYRSGDILQC